MLNHWPSGHRPSLTQNLVPICAPYKTGSCKNTLWTIKSPWFDNTLSLITFCYSRWLPYKQCKVGFHLKPFITQCEVRQYYDLMLGLTSSASKNRKWFQLAGNVSVYDIIITCLCLYLCCMLTNQLNWQKLLCFDHSRVNWNCHMKTKRACNIDLCACGWM